MIITERFNQHNKIGELVDMVKTGELTLLNAKEVMFTIIDGD